MRYVFRRFVREDDSVPELTDGFQKAPGSPEGGFPAFSFCTDRLPRGMYRLHIAFTARKDISRLYLFTGRKQLREILSLKKGERYENTFFQLVTEIIPRFYDRAYPVERLFFSFCGAEEGAVEPDDCYVEPAAEGQRIFLCGDSTVTDHPGDLPYHPGACYAAWGQALPAFLTGDTAVENQAHCGLTTETFRQEGHLDIVKKYIRPGDLCLIQFAHNDQKLPHLLADREYPRNLERMIRELREKGAEPVLVTPLGRNIWNKDGTYRELLGEHTRAVKETGIREQVPVIDLHQFSVDFIRKKGMEAACSYFHPDDYTHTNEYGAYVFAAFMAGQLCRLFPDRLTVRKAVDFEPPAGLWKQLAGKKCGAGGRGQKEEFDAMEKSVAALLAAVAAAKGEKDGQTESL